MKRSGRVLRFVDAVVVDAVGLCAQQRGIGVVEQRDGKAAAEVGDAGKRPSLCPAVGGAEQMFDGKIPGVAHDKVVGHVEGGQSPAQGGINGVYLLANV